MKILCGVLLTVSLCSCGFIKTNEIVPNAGTVVPPDRILLNQPSEAGMAKFTISRDTGYLGGGCYIGVEIDRKLAARFDTGEVATFNVKPGNVELSVVGDPFGGGLCGLGFAAVRETYDLPADKLIRFRLSSRQYRRPELESSDVEPVNDQAKSPAPVSPASPTSNPVATAPSSPVVSGPPITAVAPAPRPADGATGLTQGSTAKSSATKEMRYQFSAEALAKTRQCTAHPIATLVVSAPGSETYSIRCDSGEALIERCDYGNCRVLQ